MAEDMKMQSASLMSAVSDMVGLIGQPDFGDRFFGVVGQIISADHCTVFVSDGDGVRTLVAAARGNAAHNVRALAHSYSARGYRDDPVWNRNAADAPETIIGPDVFAPGDFVNPSYRREFYDRPNILEELALSARFEDGRRVYASFYRVRGRSKFTSEEVAAVQESAPTTLRILAKHAEICERTAAPRPPQLSQQERYARVHHAILDDNRQLTNREAEVCTGIVLGYTVLGLSLNMGIGVNTVATHRKRAYAKLNISSQNELFAHYFALIEQIH